MGQQGGIQYDEQWFTRFSSDMTALKSTIDDLISGLEQDATATVTFGETSGFISAHKLSGTYQSRRSDLLANLTSLSNAIDTLNTASGKISQKYKDATAADTLGAKTIDAILNGGS